MGIRKHLPNFILGIGAASLALATVSALMQSETSASRSRQETPRIISKIKSIEVAGASIDNRNEETTAVVIEVRNTSDKPVIAIAVESGDDKDASGVSVNGFKSADAPPTVIIKPYDILKIRVPFSNVRPGAAIKISGVMYLDGTEEGDEAALGTIRRQKEHEKKSGKGVPARQ